jgi:SAM-dependent methyltransferase
MAGDAKYGYGYYEGDESNYGILGGYTSLPMRFCRFFVYRKAMSILRKQKREGRLLDVGCAYGFWADFSRKKGFGSSGCDVSGFAVSAARERFPHTDFLQADIENPLDFPSSHFDVVTAFDVLEHCKDIGSVLSELKRMLNDGGVLLVSVPDSDLFPKERDRDGTHIWHVNFEGWKGVFEKNGFVVAGSWVFPSLLKNIKPAWCVRFILLRKH